MSSYVSVADLGPGVDFTGIPSMKVVEVPKTFNQGYNALTHNVVEPDNYFNFSNAYFLPEVKTTAYKMMKRKCDGSKLYGMKSNL